MSILDKNNEERVKLNKLEAELIELISLSENDELMTKFIEWQEQRNVCNESFIKMMDFLNDND